MLVDSSFAKPHMPYFNEVNELIGMQAVDQGLGLKLHATKHQLHCDRIEQGLVAHHGLKATETKVRDWCLGESPGQTWQRIRNVHPSACKLLWSSFWAHLGRRKRPGFALFLCLFVRNGALPPQQLAIASDRSNLEA